MRRPASWWDHVLWLGLVCIAIGAGLLGVVVYHLLINP